MKRIISISMAIVIFALSVLPSVPALAISSDPDIAAHQGDCPHGFTPLTEATFTDENGMFSFAADQLLNIFTFGWLGSKTEDDFYREVTEAYVSSVVATDETNFNSIVTDMLAAGCANYIYINEISGNTVAGAYFWELLDGICDGYFYEQIPNPLVGKWLYIPYGDGTLPNLNPNMMNSSDWYFSTAVPGGIYLTSFGDASHLGIATDESVTPNIYIRLLYIGYYTYNNDANWDYLLGPNKYAVYPSNNCIYRPTTFGGSWQWFTLINELCIQYGATGYSNLSTALDDLYNGNHVVTPDVGDPNGDGYTREPDTTLTFDPSTWFSFDWPFISNDTYITEGSDYSTTTVNYNEYINNYYNYASDDSTNLLLRILVTLREYLPILADISDMVSDGFTQTNEYLSEIASNISFLEDIKSLLEDIKATTLAILAAVVFDHDVTEIVNDEDDGNAVTYTIGFIILVLLIFVYILKIAVHLLAFIVAFFNIEAAIDPDFLPEGMVTGFQWLDEIIIPYFEVSVWDMMQTFLFVVVIFAIVHNIMKFAKDFKFGE